MKWSQHNMNTLMAVLVATTLVLSLVGLYRLDAVERRLERLSYSLSQQEQMVRQEIGRVESALARREEEEAWHSRPVPEFVGLATGGSEAYLTLTWSFRSLARDAEVMLSYRITEGDWIETEAERISELTYRSSVQVPARTDRPFVGVEYSGGEGAPTRIQEVGGRRLSLEYVIHAREGNQRKSGSPGSMDISKMVGQFTARVERETGGEAFNVRVQRPPLPGGGDNVARIVFLAEEEGEEIAGIDLVRAPADGEEWSGRLAVPQDREVTRLVLRVVYTDGSVGKGSLTLR